MTGVRCKRVRQGKFGKLQCCLLMGHAEPCNYVVVGVAEHLPIQGSRRTRSDVEYQRGRAKKEAAKAKAKEQT